jgi:surface-anchored protein
MSASNFETSRLARSALAAALLFLVGCGDDEATGDDRCESGYQERGGVCADRDECAEGTHACTGNSTCVNRPGSYSCACPTGWESAGGGCQLAACSVRYREGHGDLYVSWTEAGGLSTALRAELVPDQGEQLYATSDVCIDVPVSSYHEIVDIGGRPAGEEWDPLGVPEGAPFWYLPEIAALGRPWFGLASDPGDLGGVPVERFGPSLTLAVKVTPPPGAHFSMWVSGPVGNALFLLSTVTGGDETTLITGSHAHVNWGFTKPGTYLVETTVSGTLTTTGQTLTSPTNLLRFDVHETAANP